MPDNLNHDLGSSCFTVNFKVMTMFVVGGQPKNTEPVVKQQHTSNDDRVMLVIIIMIVYRS